MKKLANFLWILIFLISCAPESIEVQVVKNDSLNYKESIEWIKNNTQVINTFNIVENNPYLKIDSSFRFERVWQMQLNDINETRIKNNPIVKQSLLADIKYVHTLSTHCTTLKTQSDKYGICYKCLIYDACEIIGTSSTIILFDKYGNEYFSEELNKLNVNDFIITDDGRYLGLTYGIEAGPDGGILVPYGYKIIDTEKKITIIDRRFNNKESFTRRITFISTSNDFILFPINAIGSQGYEIFNCMDETLYKSDFIDYNIKVLHSINTDSVIFQNSDKSLQFEPFSEIFKIVENKIGHIDETKQ